MAKWIWFNASPEKEEYGRFRRTFTGGTELRIAADTDYIAYVNGTRVGFGAFPGWRDEKFYDTLDISGAVKPGENVLEVTARYEGVNSLGHIDDGAGLWFEIPGVCGSDESTLCCADTGYLSHEPRHITSQLGLASDMVNAPLPQMHPAIVLERDKKLSPRPVKLMEVYPKQEAALVDADKRIYDLGCETAGYLFINIDTPHAQKVEVAYGEHIADGCVRQKVGGRDFCLCFYCQPGFNAFEQLFVRVAGRYLEVHAPQDAVVTSIGLIPVLYPMKEKPNTLTGLDAKIYETCVRTLRLCMHYHYEDCPWREQALYVLDSRNQMLCGYRAFEDASYARANLAFIARGARDDGMLELTYPAVNTPAIPFFSVMYPVEVWEYVENTGDKTLINEVFHRVKTIMEALNSYIGENGLIRNLPRPYWNFYEWSRGSEGVLGMSSKGELPEQYDLILNCAYCFSAQAVRKLAAAAGLEAPELHDDSIKQAIDKVFKKDGIYVSSTVEPVRTRLGNAFALLIGLGDGRTVDALLNDKTLVPETLSMAGYVYDAIIAHRSDGRDIVKADIRKKYGYMLEQGATSFWETLVGQSDFSNAGSLCHGWSAMPIMYL